MIGCRGGEFLQCPRCHVWFCVPEVWPGEEVWHRPCETMLRRGDPDCAGQVQIRAQVFYFADRNRCEVRACDEGAWGVCAEGE